MKTTTQIIEECGYSGCPPITEVRMATAMIEYGKAVVDECADIAETSISIGHDSYGTGITIREVKNELK